MSKEELYALIDNGMIQNIIVANKQFIDAIKDNHQAVIRVDTMSPMPAIGWRFDGENIIAPTQETEPPQEPQQE